MFKNGLRPIHPGEVLREDYLKPLMLSANALSKAFHAPAGASMTSCWSGVA